MPMIRVTSSRNHGVLPLHQLLLTLRFYALGTMLIPVADFVGVSKATAGRIVKDISYAIAHFYDKYIFVHHRSAENFYEIAELSRVLGAIDCTHIRIQSPCHLIGEEFRNRKGYFSLNVQGVCDADLKLMNVVAHWPGSTHDAMVFNNSILRAQCDAGQFNGLRLLGDSAYPNRSYLLTPLLNTRTEAEQSIENKENLGAETLSNNATRCIEELVIENDQEGKVDEMEVGRRVVDVSFFFKALQAIGDHGPMDCKLSYLSIIGEVKVSLDSKLIMKCSMCSMKFTVCLIEKKEDRMEVNHQIVSGIISSGGSYYQLKTLTAAVALPIMSPSLYNEINNTVCDWWEKTAAHSMAEAVKEEAEYAVSIGSVDKNGTPLISVAVDGCWSKRSYGKNFSALSGAAAIIGIKTNKVLFFGVKNNK